MSALCVHTYVCVMYVCIEIRFNIQIMIIHCRVLSCISVLVNTINGIAWYLKYQELLQMCVCVCDVCACVCLLFSVCMCFRN